jgi:hypothetical protein
MKRTYRAIGILRTKRRYLLCFDQQMTLDAIRAYRRMGYGVAIL